MKRKEERGLVLFLTERMGAIVAMRKECWMMIPHWLMMELRGLLTYSRSY